MSYRTIECRCCCQPGSFYQKILYGAPSRILHRHQKRKYFLAKNNTFDITLVNLNSELYTAPTDVQIQFMRQEWKQVTRQDIYGDVIIGYEMEEVEGLEREKP